MNTRTGQWHPNAPPAYGTYRDTAIQQFTTARVYHLMGDHVNAEFFYTDCISNLSQITRNKGDTLLLAKCYQAMYELDKAAGDETNLSDFHDLAIKYFLEAKAITNTQQNSSSSIILALSKTINTQQSEAIDSFHALTSFKNQDDKSEQFKIVDKLTAIKSNLNLLQTTLLKYQESDIQKALQPELTLVTTKPLKLDLKASTPNLKFFSRKRKREDLFDNTQINKLAKTATESDISSERNTEKNRLSQ